MLLVAAVVLAFVGFAIFFVLVLFSGWYRARRRERD
jgi:hypothetical protein